MQNDYIYFELCTWFFFAVSLPIELLKPLLCYLFLHLPRAAAALKINRTNFPATKRERERPRKKGKLPQKNKPQNAIENVAKRVRDKDPKGG